MKLLLALLSSSLLAVGVAACGNSDSATSTLSPSDHGTKSSASATTGRILTIHKKDRDNDEDNNDDDGHVLNFGHVDASDSQIITTLVSRYFAAAAAEDGKEACSLLTPFVAETVVEQDGHTAGLRGSSCAVVMSKLFTHHHRELAGNSANLKVMRVGVEGDRARVALEFPEIPVVRQITARREGNRWTILNLLDGIIE
jgi:hypothetical protein